MSRIIVKNLPKSISEDQIRNHFEVKGEVTDIKLLKNKDGKPRGVAFVGFSEKNLEEELVKYFDKNYLKTSKIQVEVAKPQGDPSIKPWNSKTPEDSKNSGTTSAPPDPEDCDPSRLFLRNLPYTVTREDIEELFLPFGAIEEISLPFDSQKHRPKGFAYVKFQATESAVEAFEKLDRSVFKGRLLHIIQAKKRPTPIIEPKGTSSYKKALSIRLKELAKDPSNWNTLFLNQDTVAAAAASKQHLSKGEFVDTENEDLAVKMAMAETQVLEEVRKWMTAQGINDSAFQGDRSSALRSNSVLIAKNLPPKVSVSDVQEVFGRYGGLGRVCMPPSHTIAIVEYLEEGHAKNAMDRLAYAQIRGAPLYLEWAPLNTFEKSYELPEVQTKTQTSTLFVKNLNFETQEEALKVHMEQAGSVKAVKIVKNKGMPCGYGFVEYQTEKAASKALRNLNNSIVDGHALKVSEAKTAVITPSKRPREEPQEDSDNRTKITVKNLAFEATKEELWDLFYNFGEIKSVRIPQKYSGGHRGFGFVDFVSREDALKAKESLQNTHLYGRKLVLEWSQEESTFSALKNKVQT